MAKQISGTVTFYDDLAEKLTVMSKWEAICDDYRNTCDLAGAVEELVEPGKTYEVIIREVSGEFADTIWGRIPIGTVC